MPILPAEPDLFPADLWRELDLDLAPNPKSRSTTRKEPGASRPAPRPTPRPSRASVPASADRVLPLRDAPSPAHRLWIPNVPDPNRATPTRTGTRTAALAADIPDMTIGHGAVPGVLTPASVAFDFGADADLDAAVDSDVPADLDVETEANPEVEGISPGSSCPTVGDLSVDDDNDEYENGYEYEKNDEYGEDKGDPSRTKASYRWMCLHTKPRREKLVARYLRPRGLRYYLPQAVRESTTPRGRAIRSVVPLFSGYLFLHGNDRHRLESLQSNHLVQVLEIPNQDQLLADLRQVHRLLHSGLGVEPATSYPVGTPIRIRSGPLAGMVGIVERRGKHQRFTAIVQFLGQGASVELRDSQVEALDGTPAPG